MTLRTQFIDGLHREHVSEVAYLYERRLAQLALDVTTIGELESTEQRLLANFEGLLIEADDELTVVREYAQSSEPGECYAVLRALGRRNRLEEIGTLLPTLAWSEPKLAHAAASALGCELSLRWTPDMSRWLDASSGAQTAALARAIGLRYLGLGTALLQRLATGVDDATTFLWALGRLRWQPASEILFANIKDGPPETRQAAALATLQLTGAAPALAWLERAAATQSWAAVPLVVAGGPKVVETLRRQLDKTPGPNVVAALGLSGSLAAIEPLLAALKEPTLAQAAATALHLISGAELWDEVPDLSDLAFDEDELVAWREGRLNARRAGMTVMQLCRDWAQWERWWHRDGRAFSASARYRLGQPFTCRGALAGLLSLRLPPWLRNIMAQEIEIRYGFTVRFAAEMMVSEQRRCVAEAEYYLASMSAQPGTWQARGGGIQ